MRLPRPTQPYIDLDRLCLYLAVVVDAFSRRVVGWSLAHPSSDPTGHRCCWTYPSASRPEDVIHHSDQGSQYTSIEFGKRCRRAGVRLSMGSRGDCYDNALCESFFATLECELLSGLRFAPPSRPGWPSSTSWRVSTTPTVAIRL